MKKDLSILEKRLNYSTLLLLIMFIRAEEKCTDFELFTDKFFPNIGFTDNDIERILSCLDRNKTHDHDKMSTCRLNICGDCIKKALGLIFKDCLEHGSFSQNWKKANAVPIHKKLQAINKKL